MGIYGFIANDLDCAEYPELVGIVLEIEYWLCVGDSLDEINLRRWGIMIASAVLANEFSHNDLIAESVHIRILSGDDLVVDTITSRNPLPESASD